jgi:prepilin-type N-terminal cleavage/methylation domain-containing protein
MNTLNHDPSTFHRAARRRRDGFTLVEVMISVALVLLLMYGVTQVFKMTGDAVGANQAVAKIVRDQRSAQAVLREDIRNCASDSPLFLICSRIGYGGPAQPGTFVTGFRNVQEQRDNGDPDPTTIDGQSNTQFLRLGASDRIPRLDRLSFFARGSYRRQSTPKLAGANLATSGEAYIWLGHLAIDNGSARTNPDAQFAADRILGREAILLKDPSTLSAGLNGADYPVIGNDGAANAALWPLGYDALPFKTYSDVAPVTLDQFRQTTNLAYDPGGGQPLNLNWFRPMEFWGGQEMRFWCRPTVIRPMGYAELSATAPIFVTNCTQFIVEYAGDYLNQDPLTGLTKHGAQNVTVTNGQYDPTNVDVSDAMNTTDGVTVHGMTDGQIDYILDKSADPTNSTPSKWVHRVRWYGLPRDVNEDGKIDINDVVPLADVLAFNGIKVNNKLAQASWEKDLPPSPAANDYANLQNTQAPGFRYTCAWRNDAPPMIRILIKIDDPTGKLQDGQWYEYVLSR